MLRGAKLSVVKKRRREVSEEMPINVPIIARKFRMYFIVCVCSELTVVFLFTLQ